MDKKLKRLERELRVLLAGTSDFVKRQILIALVENKAPDDARLAAIFASVSQRGQKIIAEMIQISSVSAVNARFDIVDRRPIRALIRERQSLFGKHIKSWLQVSRTDIIDARKFGTEDEFKEFLEQITIGRRGQDAVRREALRALQKGFLEGSPTAKGRGFIAERLKSLSADGQTITFRVFPYDDPKKLMTFNIEKYSELVAITTASEASQVAFIQEARELDTTLIKYPHFSSDYSDDPICGRINGKIFSIVPGGSSGESGQYYPYYRDPELGVPGRYLLAHPYCRHIARAIPEAVA